jgi:hypothetical protein
MLEPAIVRIARGRTVRISADRFHDRDIACYKSHFADQSVFQFENLYLYGGLFDIIAFALSQIVPIDPYDLRHIMCALIGIGGIGAAAATARLVAGPRAGLIAAISLTVCGAWYGAMFNHTKDIPLAAAMTGATFFLLRAAPSLPRPRPLDLLSFGLLAGCCARDAGSGAASRDLCGYRDCAVSAASASPSRPRAVGIRDRIVLVIFPCAAACVWNHDLGVAMGGVGAAQSDPWPAVIF